VPLQVKTNGIQLLIARHVPVLKCYKLLIIFDYDSIKTMAEFRIERKDYRIETEIEQAEVGVV
jgi:hypothetical protein